MTTSGTHLLLEILGSAALLLWGVRMAGTSVMRAHGQQIRRILPRALSNRLVGLVAGLGASAVLQSSNAVAIFIASLAGVGAVPVAGGLAVMLGAGVGSSLVAALLALDIKGAWPVLFVAGYLAHMLSGEGNARFKQYGRFGMGLGLVLIALTFMSEVARELSSGKTIRIMLGALADDPIIVALAMAILTWLAHSSTSILLFVASLAGSGAIASPFLAAAAVLGINLGGGVPAVVMTWGQAPAARRICVGNALFRCIGVAIGITLIDSVALVYELLPGTPGLRTVLLHILFNLFLAVFFILPLHKFARLLERLLPAPPLPEGEEEFGPRYIPPISGAFQAALPLSALTRETLRMSDVVQSMLDQTRALLCTPPGAGGEKVAKISRLDDRVDTLYEAVRGYAVELTRSDLPEGDRLRIKGLLRYSLNLENVGDIIDKSLLDITAQKVKKRKSFSEDGLAEVLSLFGYVSETLQLAADVVMGWKTDAAATLVARKERFKNMVEESSDRHIGRLRLGVPDSLETSAYHLDIINDLQRINSLISDVGLDIVSGGELPATGL